MAGHSKWNNIKRKKEVKDSARAKVFTKISREILVCIRENGSADPNVNYRLRDLIAKAKSNNIPNDNIDRLLKRSQSEKSDYESCTYEGYGPGGIAIIVDCLTDNRNRTAGEMRHIFSKYGGNLGATGCASFMFGDVDENGEREAISYVELTDDEQIAKFEVLLEMLDDNDDVQEVWHNAAEEL